MKRKDFRKRLTLVATILTLTILLNAGVSISRAQSRSLGLNTWANIPMSVTRDSTSEHYGPNKDGQLVASGGQSQNSLIGSATVLTTHFDTAGHQPATKETTKLSPDGRYVAFLEYIDDRNYETRLVIIDVQNGSVERIVPGTSSGFPSNPLWSPDSNYLAYVWYEPITETISLWIANATDFSVKELSAEASFWPVLVFGATDAVVWEPDSSGLQYLDERDGRVFRVTLEGHTSEIAPFSSLIPPSLAIERNSAALTYSGMVKPLSIRDYDGTCWNGYTGLHPTYTCTSSASHPAVDMAGGPTQIGCGTPVVAVCDGTVVRTETYGLGNYSACGNNVSNPSQGFANLGWQVTLRCDNIPNASLGGTTYGGTVYITYAHLSEIQSGIANNVVVSKGQLLGKVGSTGYSEAPHLHFQMDKDNSPYHPYYPSPYPVSLVLERTWNPMYFIQAHQQDSCCGCSQALAKASSSTGFHGIFGILGPFPLLEETLAIVGSGEKESTSDLMSNVASEETFDDTSQAMSWTSLDDSRVVSQLDFKTPPIQRVVPVEVDNELPASANYQIVRSVKGMGGGPKTSSSYALLGTSGQPFATGLRTSASYRLSSGYWGASANFVVSTPTPTVAAPATNTPTSTTTATASPSATATVTVIGTPPPVGTPTSTPRPTVTSTAEPPTATATRPANLDFSLHLPVIMRE